jgi:hypothetical protein
MLDDSSVPRASLKAESSEKPPPIADTKNELRMRQGGAA